MRTPGYKRGKEIEFSYNGNTYLFQLPPLEQSQAHLVSNMYNEYKYSISQF